MENLQQAAEVEWYRAHGRYPDRIKIDSSGAPYVVGDSSWNQRRNPGRTEVIEHRMPRYPIPPKDTP